MSTSPKDLASRELAEARPVLRDWIQLREADLERLCRPTLDLDEQQATQRQLQRLLYDAGWLRLGWPESIGGFGGTPAFRALVAEELTAAGYPPPFSFGMLEVLGPAFAQNARPELASEMLPRLLSGEESWCQGFSEHEAGSDLASLSTRAAKREGGYVISGQKVWTSWAQFAQRCFLLARTGTPEDAHRGITAFFVDMDSPGIEVSPLKMLNGDAEFAELFFDDVFVPEDRILGKVGGGWAITMHVLSCERGAAMWQRGAWMLGRLRDLVAEAGDRARARPALVGEAYAAICAQQLMSRRTVQKLSAGEVPGPWSSVDKIALSKAEQTLFAAAQELLPERVLMGDETSDARWRAEALYARAASIYGGSAEIQRNLVAQRLLGLPASA